MKSQMQKQPQKSAKKNASTRARKGKRTAPKKPATRPVKKASASVRSYIILVIGMHRSGTSAVTRVLNLLGAALPGNLLPALPNNNESGFWESHALWELHEKLLTDITSSWDDPTPFPENWLGSPAAVLYRQKFSQFVVEEFADAPLGAIKDPRISRFLNLWKAGIEEAGRVPIAVIPYRNPVEVAWSLKDRDQLPASRSYMMWLRHLLLAERDSRSMRRAFVDFGRLLDGWVTVANRLSRQLGISWPCNILKANNEIEAFLQRSQRHHHEAPDALDARDDVPDWVKRTYKYLPRLEQDPTDAEALRQFDQVRDELSTADVAFAPVVRSYHEAEMKLTAAQESLDTKLSEQTQRVAELESKLAIMDKALEYRTEELTEARSRLENKNADVARLQPELAATAGELANTRTRIEEKNADVARLESELAATAGVLADTKSQMEEKNADIARLQAELEATAGELADTAGELAATKSRMEEKNADAARLQSELAARSGELSAARASVDRLGHKLRDLQSVSLCASIPNDSGGKSNDETALAEFSVQASPMDAPDARSLKTTLITPRRIGERLGLTPSEEKKRHRRIRRLLIETGLFDREFYARSNPDVVQRGMDPIEHYIKHGAAEGRLTHPLFDARFYSQQISPSELIHLDPLLHFIERGTAQGVNPHPLFDVRYYLENNPDVAASKLNPLAHYFEYGWKERRNPSIYFDSAYYETQLPAPLEEIGNPLIHYLEKGATNGLDPHPLFSSNFYLSQNADIREAELNPLAHFVDAGAIEERNPHPLFDVRYYLEQFRDIEERPLEPLRHYLEIGAWCGLDPNPYFDTAFYLSRDKGLVRCRINPLSHYLQYGASEGRATSRLFDTRLYLEANPDVAESGANPLAHFISRGLTEGRKAPGVSPVETGKAGAATPVASNTIRLREADLSSVLDMPAPPEVQLNSLMAASTRLVAFYLPQFHPIPENDKWWEPGFTEWTNVVRGQSLFNGLLQPKLPGELGFYDLRLAEVREKQAELALNHGIHAFCYHYYWFNGKRLLNRPLDEVIASGKPDFPFCICWANENWTRRWDGLDGEVLISQTHSLESDRNFIREIMPILEDRRYLKVNGCPLLLVYRPDLFQSAIRTADAWREECARAGIGDIHLCAVQFRTADPRPLGFDAACEFPPHFLKARNITNKIARYLSGFQGRVFDLTSAVRFMLESSPDPDYTLYRGVMTGWNNIPRRLRKATVYAGGSPAHYAAWLRTAINFQPSKGAGRDNLVFINAWNEWAEGAILEPSRIEGRAYLEATLYAVNSKMSIDDIAQRLQETWAQD